MVNQCTVITSVDTVISISPSGAWYLDAGLAVPAIFPAAVRATTSYYTANVGSFNFSVLALGRQFGGAVSVGFGSAPTIIVPAPYAPAASRMSAPVLGSYAVTQTTSDGVVTGVNTMVRRYTPVPLDSWSLRYTNSACGSNGDLDNANAVSFLSAVGLSGVGPWFDVAAKASRTMVIDPGEMLDTDPIEVHIPAGFYWEKVFLFVTAGQTWTSQQPVGIHGTDFWSSQSNGEADLHKSTAAFTVTTGTRQWASVATINHKLPSTTPVVALIADSLVGGIGDVTNNSTQGYVLMALKNLVCYQRIAVSGSKIAGIVDPNVGRRRASVNRGCNLFYEAYGINDITAGTAQATIQANMIALWTQQQGLGRKGWTATHPPVSSGTFADLPGQTTNANNATRVVINNWKRDGAPMLSGVAVAAGSSAIGTVRAGQPGHPLIGYVEIADVVESSRDSGLWTPLLTVDGTHPTTAAHILLSMIITNLIPAMYAAVAA